MDILSWIIFGLVAGILVSILDPYPSTEGILGTVMLGILGSLVGGLLSGIVFGAEGVIGFNVPSLAFAILSSLLLLLISRAVRRI